jgi:hypothetical protein
MTPNYQSKIHKFYIDLLDQIFEIERKVINSEDSIGFERNINRIKDLMLNIEVDKGLYYQDPLGESFNETRTDVDARIVGESTNDLVIIEVIKPILRLREGQTTVVIRKGVVIVETKN